VPKKNGFFRVVATTVGIAAVMAFGGGKRDTETELGNGIPIIRINTKDGEPIVVKEKYIDLQFVLTDPNNPANDISLTAENFSDGQIKGRGNTTWGQPKKPYRIKFSKAQSLFGLEAAKSWILLANYCDLTLIKNTFAFEMGRKLGVPFTNSYHHVDLYLNGEYKGNYLLTEHKEVAKGRVDIDKTEGWLVEMDSYFDEDPKFSPTKYQMPIMITSPDFGEDSNDPRYDFVKNDWNGLCNLMASESFPENGYRDLIDMKSIINFFLVNTIIQNSDFNTPNSVYFHKDKGGKISGGILWDFDFTFGNTWQNNPEFALVDISYWRRYPTYPFFARFFQDPIFLVKWKENWNDNYHVLSQMTQFIDDMANENRKSAEENYKVWKYRGHDPVVDFDYWINEMKKIYNERIHKDLNVVYNWVNVLPANKTFTDKSFGYSEVAPQKFTFVAYDDITNMQVKLKKAGASAFEIIAEPSKEATGDGGYLVTVSVKPKNSLYAGSYTDSIILSGENQGYTRGVNANEKGSFSVGAPVTFVVAEETGAFGNPAAINVTYSSNTRLSDLALPSGYVWANGATVLNAGNNQSFAAIFSGPSNKYTTGYGNIVVNVAKADNEVVFTPGKQKISSGYVGSNEFDLSTLALDKVDHGTLSYSLGTFTDQDGNNRILSVAPSLNGHILTYKGNGKESGVATQVIIISSRNYNDVSVIITFEATPKTEVKIAGLTIQNGVYDGNQKTGYIGTATSGAYTGDLEYVYAGTNMPETKTAPKNAGEYTLRVSVPDSSSYYTGSARYTFVIEKIKVVKPTVANTALVYTGNKQAAGIKADAAYEITGDNATNAGGYEAKVALKDKVNYEWAGDNSSADLELSWTIEKATFNPTVVPTEIPAKIGQKLADVALGAAGWTWMNPAEIIAVPLGEQMHKAKFTPSDSTNYKVLENIEVKVVVSAATPINKIQKSDGRVGIRLSKTVVSDKAEFEVILPDNDKAAEVKVVIYDNTGNVVFETSGRGKLSWNLTNGAGRSVANGTYLIIAEARGANGGVYAYSAKVGVRR